MKVEDVIDVRSKVYMSHQLSRQFLSNYLSNYLTSYLTNWYFLLISPVMARLMISRLHSLYSVFEPRIGML